MSGILSKIEAIDDVEFDDVEAIDNAVSRVFGAPAQPAVDMPESTPPKNLAAATSSNAGVADARGIPMPPIGDRAGPRKPEPPKARSGPRPNISTERVAKPQVIPEPAPTSKPPEAPKLKIGSDNKPVAKRTAPPTQKQNAAKPAPQSQAKKTSDAPSILNEKTAAATKAPAKGGRVPPRVKKRMEQQEAVKSKPPTAPQPAAAKASPSKAKLDGDDANAKRRVAMPDKLQRKQEAVQEKPRQATPEVPKLSRQSQAAPVAAKPGQVKPAAPKPAAPKLAAPKPAPQQEEGRGAMKAPPPLPSMPGQAEPERPKMPIVAERAAPPPPLPPAPPTDGGNDDGGDDGGARPLPIPESEAPAHDDAALASLKDATDLSNCLLPLLAALNWRGDKRHIAEALPHFTNSLDITSMRNILATLHYQSRPVKLKLSGIDQRLFPCLYLPEDGDAIILLGYEPEGIRIFDGGENVERIMPRGSTVGGTAYFFSVVDADDLQSTQSKVGWFRAVSERFRALVYQTLGITFVLNILALVTPLFVMAVYDKVVATGSLPTLAFFAFGVGIAIICDLILRMIRSKIMAFIGARLDNIVGIAIFHKILFLPPAFTERATIGAQVARIKDFETIRDFFTGPMAMVLFELPFVFIFIITIAALAGPVVFVSMIMMACFLILGLIIAPLLRHSVGRAARASSKKQELIVETLSGMRAVKYCGAEDKWMERFREFSASAALNSFYTAQLSALMQTISHVLMISAGLGTIIFGVFRVMNGDMTVGGLVASMILVWRVLAPLQTGFVSLTRLTQVKSSISQINNLMNIKGERDQHAIVNPIKQIEGFVTFARVSIRYSPDSDPALVGISFELEPGEVICIVGGNGSGKSTVLKLLAGMYAPQAGSIRIDNMDIRQMDTVELRHAVAYVPQTVQFFYGTIAQNLRLAHPTATVEDLYRACEMADVLDDVLALSQGSGKWKREGFEVRIGDSSSSQMPTNLLQRLNLARGYLKRSPIMLFDEPGNGLDFASDQAFMKTIDKMRGETTILMVTHRPSHLKLADKILWLEYGNVRAFGPAEEVLKQMPKDFV